jgi:hypothetical protein
MSQEDPTPVHAVHAIALIPIASFGHNNRDAV